MTSHDNKEEAVALNKYIMSHSSTRNLADIDLPGTKWCWQNSLASFVFGHFLNFEHLRNFYTEKDIFIVCLMAMATKVFILLIKAEKYNKKYFLEILFFEKLFHYCQILPTYGDLEF